MKILVIALLLSVTTEPVKLPSGVTCTKVHEHYNRWYWVGRENIIRYLISVLKYSAADVKAVERCLHKQ